MPQNYTLCKTLCRIVDIIHFLYMLQKDSVEQVTDGRLCKYVVVCPLLWHSIARLYGRVAVTCKVVVSTRGWTDTVKHMSSNK